ncbi:epoxyqueuosine reductase [Methanobrevibacter cuticularis]|uniref:Epoxyqueuosine reductase n=1 Tax=Methanobrevibacter cuticularis TaxID=47311 RepID=A0A166CQZ4_9EURY|nr:hypothetical protein [Methanobrevibacter cuticularis]KZX14775.1 epoxyqueuosine reductase [Methanobrevibacter cuticularis]
MKKFLIEKIKEFVLEDKFNKHDFSDGPGFEDPLVKIASINDSIFEDYKSIIGDFHFTPKEVFEKEFGENSLINGSVISISLPIGENIIKTNRKEKTIPSKEWTLLRSYGNERAVANYLIELLNQEGYKALAPAYSEWFNTISSQNGISSNWSERHIAYAVGLGTFSLNQAFITEKGISNRLISVVTDLVLENDDRTAEHHLANCLHFINGKCRACVRRCPINALSDNGIDKYPCFDKLYGEKGQEIAKKRGAILSSGSGCGLCQTRVPCERKNPTAKLKSMINKEFIATL